MSRQRTNAKALLRQTGIFAAATLIGSTIATPVFAATDITIDDFTKPVLFGSLALLVIALAARAKRGKKALPADRTDFNEGIGRYRPQLGRGDAS